MSQSDFGTIDPDTKSGSALATDLNSWRTALHSGHKGSSRPSYATAGMEWINDSTNPWVVYKYDGTDDIATGTIDTTTNVFTPAGISAGTTGGTATAFTYTPAIPSTGNLENQEYDIEFHTAPSGTNPTLSVSGQTALSIKYRDTAGTLQAITDTTTPSGWRSRVVNDGTYWIQRELAATPTISNSVINTKRATVASHATTADIWGAAGNEIDWTGTAAVTALPAAPQAGAVRVVNVASDGGTWLAGANIEIPGIASGSTYTSKAGDTLIIRAKTTTTFKIDIIPRIESGTWTVTLYDAASGGNASPTTVVGSYVRIRDEVRVEFASLNSIDTTGMTGGNTLYISLPFVAASVSGLSVGSVVLNLFTYPTSRIQANPIVGSGAARARLRATASGQTAADFTVASITSGVSSISSLSLSYRV